MTMIATAVEVFTIPAAAPKVGLQPWQLSRLFERGFLPPPPKHGSNRLIFATDFPRIAEAAKKAGYLRDAENAGA
jgi:hypothetical protein